MGAIIAKAYEKIGDTGSTVVEESQTLLDEIGELFIMCFVYLAFIIFVIFFCNFLFICNSEFTEGLSIDRGFLSPYFVKDTERQICEMVNPRVLVTGKKK
jgi:chaperonin GroEL